MIAAGAILIQNGTPLPEPLKLGSDVYAKGWASVSNTLDLAELEHKLTSGGWTFFYLAGALRATSFGFNRAKAMHAALKRLVADVVLHKCNCLEIDDVSTWSFLGLPCVTVSGHSRNIQKGVLFSGLGL